MLRVYSGACQEEAESFGQACLCQLSSRVVSPVLRLVCPSLVPAAEGRACSVFTRDVVMKREFRTGMFCQFCPVSLRQLFDYFPLRRAFGAVDPAVLCVERGPCRKT